MRLYRIHIIIGGIKLQNVVVIAVGKCKFTCVDNSTFVIINICHCIMLKHLQFKVNILAHRLTILSPYC
jgi:hypothetical protein